MSRLSYVAICVWVNLGIFMVCAAFLPRASSSFASNPVSGFFAARTHWDTACGLLVGTAMLSVALGLYLETRHFFAKPTADQRDWAISWFMVGLFMPAVPLLVLLLFMSWSM